MFVRPGHVFPLRARAGRMLVRAGHTEASVDVSRLAGLPPAAVICEIMSKDGTMARVPELMQIAEREGLKIGTIRDLIAHRCRAEGIVKKVDEGDITSVWGGTLQIRVYRDDADSQEHYALIKGEIGRVYFCPVRMHLLDPVLDILGTSETRMSSVADAMRRIDDLGAGAIVMLQDHSPTAVSERINPRTDGRRLKQFGIGAEIWATRFG